MEYNVIDFNDMNSSPKDRVQLIENITNKIHRLQKTNSPYYKRIAMDLTLALQWLQNCNIALPLLSGEEYYRLGYHISDDKKMVFNVQIWKHFFEDVDVLKRIYISTSKDDLDNDEYTIIDES